ncbi:MAG: hypothetical protein JWR42_2306 [Marmoricola sp.]|nr:hypothetical protein [Marmoricola sp.]
MTPRPGSLLIASASLTDPSFARSLVLLCETGPEGALGVVLDRPSTAPVTDVLPGWGPLLSSPGVLFRGGPVDTDSALALAVLAVTPRPDGPASPEGWRAFEDVEGPPLGVIDLDTDPGSWVGRLAALRVYAGYAGWGPGQLEEEVADGGWHLAQARPDDLFSARPDQLWHDVLRRQVGPVSLLTTLPEDPALN